jgi:hypothetical protein
LLTGESSEVGGGLAEALGVVLAFLADGLLEDFLLALEVYEGGGGDAVGFGEAVEGVGGRFVVEERVEEAMAHQGVDSGGDVGVFRDGEIGEVEEVGLVTKAAGVTIEGGEADSVVGEVELEVESAIGGGLAIDDRVVEFEAEVRGELGKDGGPGFNVVEGVRKRVVRGHVSPRANLNKPKKS